MTKFKFASWKRVRHLVRLLEQISTAITHVLQKVSSDLPFAQIGWNDAHLHASCMGGPPEGALPSAAWCPIVTECWGGQSLSWWCLLWGTGLLQPNQLSLPMKHIFMQEQDCQSQHDDNSYKNNNPLTVQRFNCTVGLSLIAIYKVAMINCPKVTCMRRNKRLNKTVIK